MTLMTPQGLPETWSQMRPEQRRQWRQNNFMAPQGVSFVSEDARQAYRMRAGRMIDAYNLVEPDRVPLMTPVGNLPYHMHGITAHTAMNDFQAALTACDRFNQSHATALDYYAMPMVIPAPVFSLLDYRLYTWPGHGLPREATAFQFVEGEYMHADEYEALIRDPSDFWLRTYLPRIFGVFESFRALPPLTNIIEIPTSSLMSLANPSVRETLRKLIEVGEEFERRSHAIAALGMSGPANGFPSFMGGFGKAPFDTIGDTLRGTKGILMDIYRQPDKVLAAMEVITEITIHSLVASARSTLCDRIVFPLHKGADGWMSRKQFEKFYWPPLKRVIDALVEEGLTVVLFAEGSYDSRLEYVNEFPKGSVCWWFDQTNMQRAKTVLGDNCCIQGNVPASLLVTGNPGEVKDYCRRLIDQCASGGGFILAAGCVAENPKLENLQAMMAAVEDYGRG